MSIEKMIHFKIDNYATAATARIDAKTDAPDFNRLVGIRLNDFPVVQSYRNVSNGNFRTFDVFAFCRTFFFDRRTFQAGKCFWFRRILDEFRFHLNFDDRRGFRSFGLFFDLIRTFELLQFLPRHFSLQSLLTDFLDGHLLVEVVVVAAAVAVAVVVVVVAAAAQVSHYSL